MFVSQYDTYGDMLVSFFSSLDYRFVDHNGVSKTHSEDVGNLEENKVQQEKIILEVCQKLIKISEHSNCPFSVDFFLQTQIFFNSFYSKKDTFPYRGAPMQEGNSTNKSKNKLISEILLL